MVFISHILQKQKIHLIEQQKIQSLSKPEETAVKTGLYPSLEEELEELRGVGGHVLDMDVGDRSERQQQQPIGEDDSDMPDIMRENFPDDVPLQTGGLMGDGTIEIGQQPCCLILFSPKKA